MVDPINILAELLNFLILLVVLTYLLYKPVRKFMDERTSAIEQDISSAQKQQEAAVELRAKLEAELADSKNKAQEFLNQALQRSEQMHEEIIQQAKEEQHRIQKRAQEDIALEKNKAWQELKNEVANLSLAMASKVVKESLDEAQHQAIINDLIQKIDPEELGEIQ